MSDFFSSFWGWYVAAISLISMLACLVLLWLTSKKRISSGGDNTTGHVWDEDLRELNNPLPRWWMWLFVITVLFSLVYVALYPGLGGFSGIWKWTSDSAYTTERTQLKQSIAPLFAKFANQPVTTIMHDSRAMAIGERLFMNNCAQCHGSDARGSKSFPDLTDQDWLYGHSAEQIIETITKGRNGVMPSMAAAVGSETEISELAHYVMSLSGSPHDSLKASAGKKSFSACAACHGADGKGNTALGAPNLTDNVWLHGWGENTIVGIIKNGKNNAMPAQEGKLTAEQIRVLAAYVLSLSTSTSSTKAALNGFK